MLADRHRVLLASGLDPITEDRCVCRHHVVTTVAACEAGEVVAVVMAGVDTQAVTALTF